jgi:signal transduction histidine kinase/ActR/RegA family two-component response regulator
MPFTHSNYQSKAQFEQEIADRLGLVPNLFLSAPAAPEVLQRFWVEGRSAYLDNALPSLFKERLFVYLSRFCSARYFVIRHAGYLLGGAHGYAAGDASATPQTVEQVIALLRYPAPGAASLQAALQLLLATPAAQASLPASGDPLEQALLVACGAIHLQPERNQPARDAVQHVLGRQWSELTFGLMAFIAEMHFWVRLHPEIAVETDMRVLLDEQPELALLLQRREDLALAPFDSAPPATDSAATAADQRNVRHQQFIGMFSHELRNPVAAISAVSDMFQVVGMADDRLRSASNILRRQIHVLGQTLDRMVDLSALMFGKVQLAHAPTAIDDVLASLLRELAPRLQEKGVDVETRIAGQRAFVMGDSKRLAQLFENLLLSALKVSRPPHPLRVAVSVEHKQVTVAITDHGPGFSADANPLPDPGATSAAGHSAAAGVALTVACAIAGLHRGSVRAASPGPGLGSTVTVTLPLIGHAADTKQDLVSSSDQKQRLRVLAIEDNRDFAQLFRHMLEIMGCELDITSDARSWLTIARAILPQILFCDLGLPGDMDGFGFARSLRADAALAHIPLVAVSGYNSPADVQRALDAGFNRVCGKPVKFADISEVLATFAVAGGGTS